MNFRLFSSNLSKLASAAVVSAALLAPALAHADSAGAQTFVQNQQTKLLGLVKQGAAGQSQVSSTMDAMIDYDLLAQRTFGSPCAKGVSVCVDHWNKDLTPAQRTEATALLKKLVIKNYTKNLKRTLDYDVTYKSSQEQGKDVRVRTSNKSRTKAREAPYTIDYVVIDGAGSYKIVDIVTEGSSLVKNYYEQFHKMLGTPGQGYPYIVKKLNEKLAKP